MFENSSFSHTPQADAGSIAFDAPADLTECPDKCDYRYTHKHCAVDGCIIDAEGGGGPYGNDIGGYDGTSCRGCGETMGHKCGRLVNGDGPFCRDCEHRAINAMQDDERGIKPPDILKALDYLAKDATSVCNAAIDETDSELQESVRVSLLLLASNLKIAAETIERKLTLRELQPLALGGVA